VPRPYSLKMPDSDKAQLMGFRDHVGRLTNAIVAQYSLEPACARDAIGTLRRAVASLAPLDRDLHFVPRT
jgi:hypothetical protein